MNSIGLPQQDSKKLIEALNELLADYSMLYMNTRGFHWNIKGRDFFELHVKFEEVYNELVLQIDEIAERILTLGGTPVHGYSEYMKISDIKEIMNVSDGKTALASILESYQTLVKKQRAILSIAAEMDDEGTNSQISDYIMLQEKHIWMFKAYLA
ncbi:DNA starvation/stationary phase protection protein [bacterium]|nr:DNA starvation/stationary phase protection protein [bacterium]